MLGIVEFNNGLKSYSQELRDPYLRKAQSLGFEAAMRYMQSYYPISSALNP